MNGRIHAFAIITTALSIFAALPYLAVIGA